MQFEVHGSDWKHLWTEEARIGTIVLLVLIVLLNMIFPMGSPPDKPKIA